MAEAHVLTPEEREAVYEYSGAYRRYDLLTQELFGLPWWAICRRRRLMPVLLMAEHHLNVALLGLKRVRGK